MRVFWIGLVCIVLFIAFAAFANEEEAEPEGPKYVVDVIEDNFAETIGGKAFVMLEFYAPWCGHCKHLEPEYEKAAKALKDEGHEAVLARVDGTQNQKLMAQFRVEGFPTIFFFRHGNPVSYDGPRSAEGIIEWVKARSGPAYETITTKDALETAQATYGTYVLGCIAEAEAESTEAFKDFAESPGVFGELKIVLVSDLALCGNARVELVRSFDENLVFDGEITPQGLNEWAMENGHPYFESLLASWKRVTGRGKRVCVVFLDEAGDDFLELKEWLTAVAKSNHAEMSFGYLDAKYVKEAASLGVKGEVPTAVIMVADGSATWPFEDSKEAFTQANVNGWIAKVLSGELKKTFKSDPEPEPSDSPVVEVVGTSFERIVMDTSKDVFVEFYADWCGHCKRLAPIYEELGAKYANQDDVVIAKIESARNDNGYLKIEGFPTLYFFPKNNKANPVEYTGERTLETLSAFIDEQRGHASQNHDEL